MNTEQTIIYQGARADLIMALRQYQEAGGKVVVLGEIVDKNRIMLSISDLTADDLRTDKHKSGKGTK